MLLNRSLLTCDVYSVNQKMEGIFCFSLFMNSALKNLLNDRNTKIGAAGSLIFVKA